MHADWSSSDSGNFHRGGAGGDVGKGRGGGARGQAEDPSVGAASVGGTDASAISAPASAPAPVQEHQYQHHWQQSYLQHPTPIRQRNPPKSAVAMKPNSPCCVTRAGTSYVGAPSSIGTRCHCVAADERRSDLRERADSPSPFTARGSSSSRGVPHQFGPCGMRGVG